METCGSTPSWFRHSDPDRTHLYFSTQTADHPAGLTFDYDSPGSQVLTALAEKLAGMPLFDFLNQRIFRHLGTFRTATILKVKNGDSWGDSALLCTSRDMASFARFVMNYGTWNGRRLMNEAYLRSATTAQVDSDRIGFHDIYTDGYGYQIWIVPNGFSFNGMGCQLTFCIPEKDFIFVCTADNQGYASAKSLIATALYEEILENMQDAPLPEDPEGCRACLELESKLDLVSLEGGAAETMAQTVQGKTYICRENPAGIREFSLSFPDAHTGVLRYVNAQGEKHLTFGLGKNAFGKFPQQGYSTSHGGLPDTDGYLYDCAASGVWSEPGKLKIKVQIIDRYLGNVLFSFSFRDDVAHLTMVKTAEDFLEEYQGSLVAYAQN